MVKLLIPFLPVLIRSRHIVADQIVGVIIEHIQILRALGMLETPLEIPLQVIDEYLLVRSTIDKHLVFFLIQDDPVDKSILLGSLSLPIDFPDRLACLSVKNEDIAIVEQLIYYEGEYHLFYQHNPFERDWENMHWGHAVSKDLIHWTELPDALYPDHLGTMFSGSAVIDYDNTAGFNKGKTPAMVAAFTAASSDRQVQGIAYSLDKGRTFTKYDKNPVINSKEKWNSQDTRDPKVFWYAPSKHWVLVLNERDGHSIYTSSNLKDWKYESHVTGFWECPELFELPVDGDKNHTKWVMYGATGTYMLGSFDGKVFTPEAGKYCYTTGSIYAAQTFTNIPASDGRRIQIGWGRISHPGMPFNGMMMLPTELTLRTTKDGIRLVNVPVKEVESLCKPLRSWKSLSSDEANRHLKEFYDADCLRIKTTIKLSHATDAGFNLFGQRMIGYDMNSNTLNGRFYSPQDPTSMELSADIYIDRTSIEVFIDGGLYSYSMERRSDTNNREGLHFWGNRIEVKDLQVFSVESIW